MGVNEIADKEQVVFFQDSDTGLRTITVLDGKTAGPSVGACRRRPYDDEERALADALQQAQTTAAKVAMAGLPVGGGCTVLLSKPTVAVQAARYQALGHAINSLNGRYVLMPGNDDEPVDIDQIALTTSHILGADGSGKAYWAEATAVGVLHAIELSARHRLGDVDLAGLRVAIMGLGPSGYHLAQLLRARGARITVADRDPRRVERTVRELGVTCVTTEEIIHLDTDVLAPCAAKHVINPDSLPHLRCSVVAGTADDILQTTDMGKDLQERGILYAPDFLINAGGIISLIDPLVCVGSNALRIDDQIRAMIDRLTTVFDEAARSGRTTMNVALDQLDSRLASDKTVGQNMLLAG